MPFLLVSCTGRAFLHPEGGISSTELKAVKVSPCSGDFFAAQFLFSIKRAYPHYSTVKEWESTTVVPCCHSIDPQVGQSK